jgi:putative spermidine/putrescine transport system permease protein
MSATSVPERSLYRRASAWLYRKRKLKLGMLLGPPMGWMLVVYLGALFVLLLTAFWRQDPLTALVEREWGFQNIRTIIDTGVYRTVALRTIGVAALVTIINVLLAIPIAYFAARMAKPRFRTLLLLAVVLPLWSSYLVKAYAWRVILSGEGLLNWTLDKMGLGHVDLGFSIWGVVIVFCYLWLPYVVLPIYASIERIPNSFLEASADLGAPWSRTFRKVIFPIALPGIVAGSIFSFSLTLGDYIVPQIVGNTQFIGNIIYQNVGVANNVPFAAAYALIPVAVMAIYLLIARKMGAFEAL